MLDCAGPAESDPSQATLPEVDIVLRDGSLEEVCRFPLDAFAEAFDPIYNARLTWSNNTLTNSTRDSDTGLFTRSCLFQNFRNCTSGLARVAAVAFQSTAGPLRSVSFCFEDLRLLPTRVPSPGDCHCAKLLWSITAQQ